MMTLEQANLILKATRQYEFISSESWVYGKRGCYQMYMKDNRSYMEQRVIVVADLENDQLKIYRLHERIVNMNKEFNDWGNGI